VAGQSAGHPIRDVILDPTEHGCNGVQARRPRRDPGPL